MEVETYTEEYDATDDGNVCPQYDIGSGAPAGDEDCLNLNVYSPKIGNYVFSDFNCFLTVFKDAYAHHEKKKKMRAESIKKKKKIAGTFP